MMDQPVAQESYPDTHHDTYSKTTFGFWLYLLTDFILFGSLFAVYAVLKNKTFGGPSIKEVANLSYAFWQTMLLVSCAFASGIAGAYVHRKNKRGTLVMFGLTFLLGVGYAWLEWSELSRLVAEGHSWQNSAFLSSLFALLGMHGIHVLFALLWTIFLLVPIFFDGFSSVNLRRLTCLRMFWQFLGILGILIFYIVYLMGVY